VVPIGTTEVGLDKTVTAAVQVVKDLCAAQGLTWELHSMGTIIEGPSMDSVLEIIKKAIDAAFQQGNSRVTTSIKIDDRRDVQGLRSSKKVDIVQSQLK
jgi:uncharacterized protein (TIGR00106 family)